MTRLLCALLLFAASSAVARTPVAYVTNERSGEITLIDTRTDRTIGHYHVAGRARGIRLSRDGKTLYVAVSIPMGQRRRSSPDQNRILALDAATGKIVKRYDTGIDPERLTLSNDGTRLLIAQEDAGTASIFDLKREQCFTSVVVGLQPEGVGITPDDRWAYVTSEGSNCVSVVDTRKKQVSALFFVDACPRDVLFLPHSHTAYVACEAGGSVARVDTRTHKVVERIALPKGSRPMSLVLSKDRAKLYVSNGRANTVSVVDTRTNKVLHTIPTGARTWGLALTPDGDKLYAANSLENTISVIDTRTDRVRSTLPVGDGPWGIAVSP